MSAYKLPIPDDLLTEAKRVAAANDTSLDQFLVDAIAHSIDAERTRELFARHAAEADPAAFARVMKSVPDAPPLPGDEQL